MKKAYAAVALSALLGACGGSGGSGNGAPDPNAPATSFPIAAAASAFAQTLHTYTLTAGSGALTYVAQSSYEPGSVTTFEEHIASTANVTFSITQNGNVLQYSSAVAYFQDNPYLGWGSVANDGKYAVDTGQQTLPASASVGQSGPLQTVTTFADGSRASVLMVTTQTWSLLANNAATAWWCTNSSFAPASGPAIAPQSECYAIDSSGNVSAMMFITSVNGQPLTFR
jgi:hypothetical protein